MPEKKDHLEIERKWMVGGWPASRLPLAKEQLMRQGYVTTLPTVRIREEADLTAHKTEYILCFKAGRGLTRKEIEFPIEQKHFAELEELIGRPLIPKMRRTYRLPSGLFLEVNRVDEGQPTEFWYAEIEFPSEKAARAYDPAADGLGDYLTDDVTEVPGSSMGAYWCETRLGEPSAWKAAGRK